MLRKLKKQVSDGADSDSQESKKKLEKHLEKKKSKLVKQDTEISKFCLFPAHQAGD